MLLGDWILLGIFAFYVALSIGFAISGRLQKKREAEAYQAALAFELADGVTLLQGVRAFFGQEGYWLPSSGCVLVLVRGWPGPSGYLRYEVRENRLDVLGYKLGQQEGPEADPWADPLGDPDTLAGLMVQAARRQRGGAPW